MVLIESKFDCSIQANTIHRKRLIETLKHAQGFTLVRAPAGYGKTILVNQWRQQSDARVAWLSLDNDDNEQSRFLGYFVMALSTIEPAFESLLQSEIPYEPSDYLAQIANIIKRHVTDSIYIVIDNYDVILNDEIHASIAFLLKHAIPQLHLIIVSRSQPPLPIASLRAKGLLTEITASDLRFTQQETQDYFADYTNLNLAQKQLIHVCQQTAGWIGLIQILVARLQKSSNLYETIEHFSGRDRFVSDYLMGECFDNYPPQLRSFLIKISILKWLDEDVCQYITLQSDEPYVLAILEQLGIPIFPVDTSHTQYYYHPIFASFLQNQLRQLPKDEVIALHQWAGEWYSQQDEITIDHVEQVLFHANHVSHDVLLAYLEQFGQQLLKWGHNQLIVDYLKPVAFEVLVDYPMTLIGYLWSLYSIGQARQVGLLLEQVESDLPTQVIGDVVALRAQLSNFEDNPHKSRELAQQALTILSEDDVILRALMQHNLARLLFFYDGETTQAINMLTESVTIYEQVGYYDLWAISMDLLVAVRYRHGSLLEAEALCRYSMSMCDHINRPDLSCTFFSQLGKILYERNRLSEAEQIVRRGRVVSQTHGGINSFLASSMTLARLVNEAESITVMEEAREFVGTSAYQLARITAYPISRLAEHGWIAPSIDWDKYDYDPNLDIPSIETMFTYINIAYQLCLGIMPNPRKAITLLVQLEQLATKANQKTSLLEILLLLTTSYEAVGNRESALLTLKRAVLMTQQTGHKRLILDSGAVVMRLLEILANQQENRYALRLLHDTSEPQALIIPSSIPSFTSRERDVMRLIGEGYSNPEIGDKLNISVSTTRWHVKNIYRKLGVTNRTRATIQAQQLGLL